MQDSSLVRNAITIYKTVFTNHWVKGINPVKHSAVPLSFSYTSVKSMEGKTSNIKKQCRLKFFQQPLTLLRKESQNINNALDEWSGLSLPYPHYHMINSIPKGQLRGVYCLNTRLYNGIVLGHIIITSIPSDGHPIGKATLVLLLNTICSN